MPRKHPAAVSLCFIDSTASLYQATYVARQKPHWMQAATGGIR